MQVPIIKIYFLTGRKYYILKLRNKKYDIELLLFFFRLYFNDVLYKREKGIFGKKSWNLNQNTELQPGQNHEM